MSIKGLPLHLLNAASIKRFSQGQGFNDSRDMLLLRLPEEVCGITPITVIKRGPLSEPCRKGVAGVSGSRKPGMATRPSSQLGRGGVFLPATAQDNRSRNNNRITIEEQ